MVLAKNKAQLKHSNKPETRSRCSNIQSAVLKLTIVLLGVLCWAGRNLITCMINRRNKQSRPCERTIQQTAQCMNITHFFGETDSSSMVASSSASRPKRSLLCFCRKHGWGVRGGGAQSYSEQCTLKWDVLIHTLFLITRLLEDDVNVSSDKLGYLLSLCGLDRVIALLVFSKILWVALKIAEIRNEALFYYLTFLL